MAALTLVAGLFPVSTLAGQASTEPETPAPQPAAQTVRLDLRIAGLGTKGCDVEVKPGHKGCTFQPMNRHVDAKGYLSLTIRDVRSQSADRDCTFAITIREPGQPERTAYRGLRLSSHNSAGQQLTCYLSSPSKVARAGESDKSKR
jgi:hypothetical protein